MSKKKTALQQADKVAKQIQKLLYLIEQETGVYYSENETEVTLSSLNSYDDHLSLRISSNDDPHYPCAVTYSTDQVPREDMY